MKLVNVLKLIIRLLLGGMFITTAILKLLSIEEFELYIYSFDLFNYITVTFFSRSLIVFEFLIGIFLIIKVKYRYIWWVTLLTMTGFTLFLIYVAKFRNDTNCHCFGEFIELNPVHSILKNLITIIMLLLTRNEEDYHFRFKKVIVGILLVITIVIPFVVNPMDALYNRIFSEENEEMNVALFEELKQDTILQNLNIDQGRYLLAFYMSGCKYCRLGMKKIQSIVERNEIEVDKIKIIISGSEKRIEDFKTNTKTENYHFYVIPPPVSINLIYGIYPTFVLFEDGKIEKVTSFRGINEDELVEFLK
jgi:uncharacterized membrane protein YphA (DoxX/SURF4 family)